MNQNGQMMLQRLIVELDETCRLYSNLGCVLASPRKRSAVEKIVLTHQAIADDLTEHMRTMGARSVRRGSTLDKLRARYATWKADAGADVERDYLIQIQCREVQIMQRFSTTANHVPGLKLRMHRHLNELESAFMPIASMLDPMDARVPKLHIAADRHAGLPIDMRERDSAQTVHNRSSTALSSPAEQTDVRDEAPPETGILVQKKQSHRYIWKAIHSESTNSAVSRSFRWHRRNSI